MAQWHVYVGYPEVAQGIDLKIPTAEEKLAGGDTLTYEFSHQDRASGTVIIAVPSETVITIGPDKWRIQKGDGDSWRVIGRVE